MLPLEETLPLAKELLLSIGDLLPLLDLSIDLRGEVRVVVERALDVADTQVQVSCRLGEIRTRAHGLDHLRDAQAGTLRQRRPATGGALDERDAGVSAQPEALLDELLRERPCRHPQAASLLGKLPDRLGPEAEGVRLHRHVAHRITRYPGRSRAGPRAYISPVPHLPTTNEGPEPALRTIAGPAGLLAVWEWPGGEPATLLLHGVGNYGRYWDAFAAAVAGRLRLVAPDARGHGDSARPNDGYAAADFVADAVAILDGHGIDRALVVGHSMGGYHAAMLAATHPERVRGLVIVDAGPEALPEGAERARRLSLGRPASFADRAEAEAYLLRTSPGYDDSVYENRLRWLFRADGGRLAWRSSAQALSRIFGGSPDRAGSWARAASITVPTLVVRGTRSPVLAAEAAERLVAAIPGARLLELEAGHNVALDRPRELAEAVVSFA